MFKPVCHAKYINDMRQFCVQVCAHDLYLVFAHNVYSPVKEVLSAANTTLWFQSLIFLE